MEMKHRNVFTHRDKGRAREREGGEGKGEGKGAEDIKNICQHII